MQGSECVEWCTGGATGSHDAVQLDIRDETSPLAEVVVGIAQDPGEPTRHNLTDSRYWAEGQAPCEEDLVREVEGLHDLLAKLGVRALRPDNLPDIQQIFTRDLGFVIGGKFFWSNLKRTDRGREQQALRRTLARLAPSLPTLQPPPHVLLEGGDVVLLGGKVFVGVGCTPGRRRTDPEAVQFLQSHLRDWEVIPLCTRASDDAQSRDDPREHILHLDCALQPLGHEHVVLFEQGFSERPDALLDLVSAKNLIKVSGEEMYRLCVNLLSVAPDIVISSRSSERVNREMKRLGFTVLELPYGEVAKQGGGLRCSTLPLRRRYT